MVLTLESFGQTPQLGVRPDEVGRVPIWLKPGSLRLPKSRILAPPSLQAPADGQEEMDDYMAAQVAELDTPLILVGPGTGLAPLRYVCTYVCIMRMHVCMRVSMYPCIHVCMHVCMYVSYVLVRMHDVFMHVSTYARAHTHTRTH